MSDVILRKDGRVGRITLNRPDGLNAITRQMIQEISAELPVWANDNAIAMLVIDAAGDKAFCAGGDLSALYDCLNAGDTDTPRRFWREEYALNAALFSFPKPVASFLHGYTMGGGVGIGCHASHRIVCETSRVALPECSVGLVPDVGSSLLLARAPGRVGEYLALTGAQTDPGSAIFAGLADYYVPRDSWTTLLNELTSTGDWAAIDRAAVVPPAATLADQQPDIDTHFGGETLRDIWTSLANSDTAFANETRQTMSVNAPLAMAVAVELIHRARLRDRIKEALKGEYRFVHRIVEQGDFQEGIRAVIIDKDRTPSWAHGSPDAPTLGDVSQMLRPLADAELDLESRP